MASLLLKNVHLDGVTTSILIDGETIANIGDTDVKADSTLDCTGLIALPGLWNMHTHAAMVLLRGYGDDMPLQRWLEDKVWPIEAKMTEEDISVGTTYAMCEMVATGTTFFNDQYWHYKGVYEAIRTFGMKAMIGPAYLDFFDAEKLKELQKENETLLETYGNDPNILYAVQPHSIYTVSADGLKWAADFAKRNKVFFHIHISETEKEVQDSITEHGCRPIEYLDKLGVLMDNMIFAHGCYLTEDEIRILSNYHVTVVHNPISNMKLATGETMPYPLLKKYGVNVTLGTDGACSNNTLNMFDTMKTAALLQKHAAKDPLACTAKEVFDMATVNAAEFLRLKSGKIAPGYLADIMLVNGSSIANTPSHDLYSNVVYSMNGSEVEHVIVNGKIIMQNRTFPDMERIAAQFNSAILRLF